MGYEDGGWDHIRDMWWADGNKGADGTQWKECLGNGQVEWVWKKLGMRENRKSMSGRIWVNRGGTVYLN